ncbi:hypothetical protein ACH47C_40830 [Streptomyces rishiriensis]|uniref:hypothetical protein n=1 Tax=Streptomyces rishiriensis TaxID=68264 RepID=UPI00378A0F91
MTAIPTQSGEIMATRERKTSSASHDTTSTPPENGKWISSLEKLVRTDIGNGSQCRPVVNVTNQSGSKRVVLVDVEIWTLGDSNNPPEKVDQAPQDAQPFDDGQTSEFPGPVPPKSGTYRIKVGIFGQKDQATGKWGPLLSWEDSVRDFDSPRDCPFIPGANKVSRE